MKVFDANRTLTSLTSVVRRTVDIDGLHLLTLKSGMEERLGGRSRAVDVLSDVVSILPGHALVRRHPKLDFCIVLPVMRCTRSIAEEPLAGLPLLPCTPSFALISPCKEGEIFVALHKAPGAGPRINKEAYKRTSIPVGERGEVLVFPPDDEAPSIELRGVMKGDVGAAVQPGALIVGDVLLCRGKHYTVKGVTGGGRTDEVHGGRDLMVFNSPFNFNCRRET